MGSGCRRGRRPAARVAAGAVVTVTVTVTDIMMACPSRRRTTVTGTDDHDGHGDIMKGGLMSETGTAVGPSEYTQGLTQTVIMSRIP